MAISKTFLVVALVFAVLLISAEVSAHRDLAETTTTTENANTDDNSRGRGGPGGKGGHGGTCRPGHCGGHGPQGVETETEN